MTSIIAGVNPFKIDHFSQLQLPDARTCRMIALRAFFGWLLYVLCQNQFARQER
jgi:hypothetical protein